MFLFAWLGSMLFWLIYLTLTLFMGTLIMRQAAPQTYRFITNKRDEYDNDMFTFEAVLLSMAIYLFWPFILIWMIFSFIMKIAFGMIFGPAIKRAINFADSVMPKIEIKKRG